MAANLVDVTILHTNHCLLAKLHLIKDAVEYIIFKNIKVLNCRICLLLLYKYLIYLSLH